MAVAGGGQRAVTAVAVRIDGHNVGAVGERAATGDREVPVMQVEDGQPAAP